MTETYSLKATVHLPLTPPPPSRSTGTERVAGLALDPGVAINGRGPVVRFRVSEIPAGPARWPSSEG
jgi:hypothetical protein